MGKEDASSDIQSWVCPALPEKDQERTTFTYHHSPQITESVIIGVDEAGRGPVLGPMVYAVAYCPVSFEDELASLEYDDSKVLTAAVRERLMHSLVTDEDLSQKIGWATTIMTANDISAGMLRPGIPYNLNEQAHDATIALVQLVINSGTVVDELYVDTVGPPEKYQAKLAARFPSIKKVVVAKKADSLYPIVSCASICAKVTRDSSLSSQLSNCGSGYPADPNTVSWLNRNLDRVFGWGHLVRYSWGTAKTLLEEKAFGVTWDSRETKSKQTVFNTDTDAATTAAAANTAKSRANKGVPRIGVDDFASPVTA